MIGSGLSNKIVKSVRVVAFLFSVTVAAAFFGSFNAWVISRLDPAQQEIISLAYAPSGVSPASVRSEPNTMTGHQPPMDRLPATVASTPLRKPNSQAATGITRPAVDSRIDDCY